jgi:serine protease Do
MRNRCYAILVAVALAAAPSLARPPLDAQEQSARAEAAQEVTRVELERIQREVESAMRRAQQELQRHMVELEAHRATVARAAQEATLRAQQEVQRHLAATEAQRAAAVYAAQREVERALREAQLGDVTVLVGEEESGWLGVTIGEVTAEKVKELKLAAERGVLVTDVEADSPAAKAGLKANDVITEFNGIRVEGSAQFRRLVRETPPGRSVQLTVWREGRSQTLSAQLSSPRARLEARVRTIPHDFTFSLPRIETYITSARPILGVSTEDVSGQLGNYFGAPGGEGVLIREVNAGSPAEKAGLKAGDVIIKVAGERVRNSSELREKLRVKRDQKTVAIGIIRKGAEMSFNVEIEQPRPPERRVISRRTAL